MVYKYIKKIYFIYSFDKKFVLYYYFNYVNVQYFITHIIIVLPFFYNKNNNIMCKACNDTSLVKCDDYFFTCHICNCLYCHTNIYRCKCIK